MGQKSRWKKSTTRLRPCHGQCGQVGSATATTTLDGLRPGGDTNYAGRMPLPDVRASAAGRSARRAWVAPGAWCASDVVLILAFAASGRRTHEHGVTIAGVLDTAWPFFVAYALAALAIRAWRAPATGTTAVVLWLGTVAGGLALRALSGEGVAVSFQIVTLLVLGIALLLPRAVLRLLRGRREPVA